MNWKSFMPLALLAALGLMRDERGGPMKPRRWTPKGSTRKVYAKLNRERECARRRRQIERGIIRCSTTLETREVRHGGAGSPSDPGVGALQESAPGGPGQEVKP